MVIVVRLGPAAKAITVKFGIYKNPYPIHDTYTLPITSIRLLTRNVFRRWVYYISYSVVKNSYRNLGFHDRRTTTARVGYLHHKYLLCRVSVYIAFILLDIF